MRSRAVLLALLATALTCAPAAAYERSVERSWQAPTPIRTVGQSAEAGGVRVFGLPARLGDPQIFDSVGDDDERIATAVWEERRGAGWEVQASFTVVRAPWLADPAEAFSWFTRWQQRPVHEAVYREVTLPGGSPAWLADDQVIWQPEGGAIASMRLHDRDATPGRLRSIAASSTTVAHAPKT